MVWGVVLKYLARLGWWAAWLVVACNGSLEVDAAVPTSLQNRLQRAVRLPEIDVSAGFAYNQESLLAEDDIPDPNAAALKLQGQLTGEPSDASRWLRLARLHQLAGDPSASKTALEKALVLFRKRVSLQPEDIASRVGLGEALDRSGSTTEAESVLRDAVARAPKEAQAWSALGRFWMGRAQQRLNLASMASNTRPSAAQLEEATRWRDEARRCFDNAVESAPKQARPRADRAGFLSWASGQDFLLKQLQGQGGKIEELTWSVFSTNAIPDLEFASSLAPHDYRLHAASIWFQVFGNQRSQPNTASTQGTPWENLSSDLKNRIRPHLQALENLGDDSDPQISSGALENLAVIQAMLMMDPSGASITARRALRRDATRAQAWELLLGTLISTERWEELLALLEDRVKQRPEPRSFFMQAKVLAQRDQWDESYRRLRMAMELWPNDILIRLSYACLLIRRSQGDILLPEARAQLEALTKLLGQMKEPQDRSRFAMHAGVTSAILFALEGNEDEARQFLKSVTASNPGNAYASSVLEILGN